MAENARAIDYGTAPDLVLETIFSFLNTKDLVQASRVCKRWHRISQYPPLWKRFVADDITHYHFAKLVPRLPNSVKYLKIRCHCNDDKKQLHLYDVVHHLRKYCPELQTLMLENVSFWLQKEYTKFKIEPNGRVAAGDERENLLSVLSMRESRFLLRELNATLESFMQYLTVLDLSFYRLQRGEDDYRLDSFVEVFLRTSNLEEIYMAECEFLRSDGIVESLQLLTKLKVLDVEGKILDNDKLRSLLTSEFAPKLEKLYLGFTFCCDFHFVELSLPRLHFLCLCSTRITEIAIERLLQQCHSIQRINVSHTCIGFSTYLQNHGRTKDILLHDIGYCYKHFGANHFSSD